MNRIAATTLALSAALAAAAPAAAQGLPPGWEGEEVLELDTVVLSGNREAREAERNGATVSVLEAGDLDRTGEPRLTDILARLPGVGILGRGPVGTQTGFTLRGVSQNYVKVLMDGIDVTDPSGPQVAFDFGRLTSFGVGRVELLRGSQSALYGSQAVAGVLSIGTITPQAEGTEQRLAVEAGSYGTLIGQWSLAHRGAAGDLAFTLSRIQTDGFSAADEADGNTEADGYAATRLSVSGRRELENGVALGFAAFLEDTRGDYDESFPLADGSPDEVSEATSYGARVYAEFATGAVEHRVEATLYDITRRLTGSSSFGDSVQDYDGRRVGLGWQAAADLGRGRLVFGLDRTRESYGQASDFGFGLETNGGAATLTGAFAEYAFAPNADLDVTATLRHDRHSRFGGKTTGRLAAAWRPAEGLTLRASAATGFRAPSGYELFGPYGDPALTPEDSRSLDLGVERRFGEAGMVRATLFRIDADNLIDFSFPSYLQIPGKTRRQGVEIEGALALGRATLTAAYTYTDAENPALDPGNTWNAGFGRHQLALGLDAELTARLTGSVNLLHVADRPALPDYTVVNAVLALDLGRETEAYLRVENLFDEHYQQFAGYGTSGRALYVGLRKSF